MVKYIYTHNYIIHIYIYTYNYIIHTYNYIIYIYNCIYYYLILHIYMYIWFIYIYIYVNRYIQKINTIPFYRFQIRRRSWDDLGSVFTGLDHFVSQSLFVGNAVGAGAEMVGNTPPTTQKASKNNKSKGCFFPIQSLYLKFFILIIFRARKGGTPERYRKVTWPGFWMVLTCCESCPVPEEGISTAGNQEDGPGTPAKVAPWNSCTGRPGEISIDMNIKLL